MYKNMFIFAYRSVKSVGHHSKKKLFSLPKMAPYHVLLGKMPLFPPVLGLLGNDPTHISCKIYFLLLVDPLQLSLKIAILLGEIPPARRLKKCTAEKKTIS